MPLIEVNFGQCFAYNIFLINYAVLSKSDRIIKYRLGARNGRIFGDKLVD